MAKKETDKPMTKEQEALFADTLDVVTELIDTLKDEMEGNAGRLPCREFSIAFTKLEEAEMWLGRGFEEMGYEVPEPDDGDDEEEAEEEEKPAKKAKDESE